MKPLPLFTIAWAAILILIVGIAFWTPLVLYVLRWWGLI